MNIPRWLTPRFMIGLKELETQFVKSRYDGVINIQIHYRGGIPKASKVLGATPVMLELSLASTS